MRRPEEDDPTRSNVIWYACLRDRSVESESPTVVQHHDESAQMLQRMHVLERRTGVFESRLLEHMQQVSGQLVRQNKRLMTKLDTLNVHLDSIEFERHESLIRAKAHVLEPAM